jgi:hypothetical protein
MTNRRSARNVVGRSLPGILMAYHDHFSANLPHSSDDSSHLVLLAKAHFEGPAITSRKLTGFLTQGLWKKGQSYLTYKEWKS